MPSGNSSRQSRPKPSDVAAENKKHYIPHIKQHCSDVWPTQSWLVSQPMADLVFSERPADISPPQFLVSTGDPIEFALNWAKQQQMSVPVICTANDKRPGGDWETGVLGFEERLCRRSTLAAALATPAADGYAQSNYPIPSTGGIFSPSVVVFRGPHDRYEVLPAEEWRTLPVCSVPPTRWPKLTQNGTKYSFHDERELVKDKLRGALRICAYNGATCVVITGDFGLGNGSRNPPQELAELWREVFLYDPDLRGRIRYAAFVFEDPAMSTAQLILDDIAKKFKGKGKSSSSSSAASLGGGLPSDYQIFGFVFSQEEVGRVIAQPDSRYGLDTLLG